MAFRFSVVALAALLASCGGRTVETIPAPNDANQTVSHGQTYSHSQTFKFTGKPQRFNVPNVRWLQVVVRGASGGAPSGKVARGARVYALIPAALSRTLVVYVGGAATGTNGGFNGGGTGGSGEFCSNCNGYGGGGASDIRLAGATLGDRVIVAGGGGGRGGDTGNGAYPGGAGGAGGGSTGASGSNGFSGSYSCEGHGGGGGSQIAGGTGGIGGDCVIGGGYPGNNGEFGNGGAGGAGYDGGGGGGGGGGFYGGGGGGGGISAGSYGIGGAGGGGGGPCFVGKRAMHSHTYQNWKNAIGDGLVVISW